MLKKINKEIAVASTTEEDSAIKLAEMQIKKEKIVHDINYVKVKGEFIYSSTPQHINITHSCRIMIRIIQKQ